MRLSEIGRNIARFSPYFPILPPLVLRNIRRKAKKNVPYEIRAFFSLIHILALVLYTTVGI